MVELSRDCSEGSESDWTLQISLKSEIKVSFITFSVTAAFVCAITQKRRTELRQLLLMFHRHLLSAAAQLLCFS